MKLTLKALREAVESLRAVAIKNIVLNMRHDIALSVQGVVVIPGFGFMSAETFKDCMGEEAYQELLRRPRVRTEYDTENEI